MMNRVLLVGFLIVGAFFAAQGATATDIQRFIERGFITYSDLGARGDGETDDHGNGKQVHKAF